MKKKRIGAPVPISVLSKLWKIMRLSVFFYSYLLHKLLQQLLTLKKHV